jgi:hypothetical protein
MLHNKVARYVTFSVLSIYGTSPEAWLTMNFHRSATGGIPSQNFPIQDVFSPSLTLPAAEAIANHTVVSKSLITLTLVRGDRILKL